MNKFRVFVFLAGAMSLSVAVAAERKDGLSEDRALDVLLDRIHHDHLYDSHLPQCLHYYAEDTTDKYVEFAIREKHDGKKCKGAIEVEPIVDRFRIDRHSQVITWFDVANDRYEPYQRVFKDRGLVTP